LADEAKTKLAQLSGFQQVYRQQPVGRASWLFTPEQQPDGLEMGKAIWC
jgi:hypothetical protein